MDIAEREGMLNLYSDLFKDVNGFRPRWNYNAMTDAELQQEWDGLVEALDRNIERDKVAKANAKAAHDNYIEKLMVDYNIDHETAERWDMEAWDAKHGGAYDRDYYAFLKGF